jgi:hypothetical protein
MDRACSTHGEEEICGNLKRKGHFGDLCIERSIMLQWTVEKLDVSVWSGFKWLRSSAGDAFLHASLASCFYKFSRALRSQTPSICFLPLEYVKIKTFLSGYNIVF